MKGRFRKLISLLMVLALLTVMLPLGMAEEALLEETEITAESDLAEADLETSGEIAVEQEEAEMLPLPTETDRSLSEPEAEAEVQALEDQAEVQWPGAFNLTPSNNNLTSVKLPVSLAAEQWKAQVASGDSEKMAGLYAGQMIMVDNYIYLTSPDGLVKVDSENGDIVETIAGIGSNGFMYYDYLTYGEGLLFVATNKGIFAYDFKNLSSNPTWSVEVANAYYHPLVYHQGYLYCNGRVLRASDGQEAYTLAGNFNWSAGAFVTLNDESTEIYYVNDLFKVYAVEAQTGTIIDSQQFSASTARINPNTCSCPLAYSSENNRLYWGAYQEAGLYSVQIDLQTGKFMEDSLIAASEKFKTVVAPVIYQDRVYLGTQEGQMVVYKAEDLECLYVTSNQIGKIQSTPILSTAYGSERAYLYMQSYNHPGSLYLLAEDYDDSNLAELREIAVPSVDSGVAYAYEQIAFDPEGALYCYNETGNLFKFVANSSEDKAQLSSLEVRAGEAALGLTPEFSPDTYEYTAAKSTADYATIWPTAFDSQANLEVSAVSGVSEITSGISDNQTYYKVAFSAANAVVQIKVSLGQAQEIYRLTLPNAKTGGGGGSSGGGEAETITVLFSLQGDIPGYTYEEHGSDDYVMWIEEEELTLKKSEALNGKYLTVADALFKALDEAGLKYEESGSYVSGINGLYEFDNGPNSGWMYKVGDTWPQIGLREYQIADGDEIYWHYVRDYTKESQMPDDVDGGGGGGGTNSVNAKLEANVQKGIASYQVSETNFADLLAKSQKDSEFKGYLEFTLEVNKSLQDLVKSYELKFPLNQVKEILADQETVLGLKMTCQAGYLAVLDNSLAVLQNMPAPADYLSLQMQALKWEALSPEQQKVVDNKALLQQYQLYRGTEAITTLSGGTFDLGWPYKLAEGKNLSSCYLYLLEGTTLTPQLISGYDSANKLIYFKTNKLGTYVLADKALTVAPVKVEVPNSSGVEIDSSAQIPAPLAPNASGFTSSFGDIAGNPYEAFIIAMEEAGIFKGNGQGNFYPEQELNQTMLAAILFNLNQAVEGETSPYSEPWPWAEEQKITSGNPQGLVTREELAAAIYNYLDNSKKLFLLNGTAVVYNDILEVSLENRAKVKQILTGGLMAVDQEANFKPQEIVNRAFTAEVMQNLLHKY